MSGARITIAGFSLPLTTASTATRPSDTATHPRTDPPGRSPMQQPIPDPTPTAGPAPVRLGGFSPRTTSPAHQRPAPARPVPAAAPVPAARPGLRLVSATTRRRPSQPLPRPTEGAWRYWVSVVFTDGHTGATLEVSRTGPIIGSDDRTAVADAISAHLQRPVASVQFITPITRPHDVTGEPEPDVDPRLRTSPAEDPQPWHYRVSYATAAGRRECTVDRAAPICGSDDLKAVQDSISAQIGRPVVAVESFSVLAAPALAAAGGAGA